MFRRPSLAHGLSGLFLVYTAPSAGQSAASEIALLPPTAPIARDQATGLLKVRLANLAKVDPARPLADARTFQTLSLFGREDLIAASSDDYRRTLCRPRLPAQDPLAEIERRARQTSIVIISESHERSEHRGFSARVAERLRGIGYDTLAIETLTHNAPDVKLEYRPAFIKTPALSYMSDGDGYYLAEAGFGRFGRIAKALNYRLLPYEIAYPGPPPANETRADSIARREEAQASTLSAFVKANPRSKLMVHVGYNHAREVPTKQGDTWMAARLKAKTGIDPLTISQTVCRGGASATRLSLPPVEDASDAFDLIIDHPTARFVRGRPAWRIAAGDRAVAIPATLEPALGWRVIEARPVGEPDTSVPMDRVAIRPSEKIALILPPGRYQLRAIDITPATTNADR